MDVVGGHGAERHVYYSWKETADRIINPQPGARIPTASSRTLTIEDADRLVKETLKQNTREIEEWLSTSKIRDTMELTYIPLNNQLTGFGIKRGSTSFEAAYKMRVILVRTKSGYILDKYYPSFE